MAPDPAWKKAKELLIQDIARGFVPPAMNPMAVKKMIVEYQICKDDNFNWNLQALQKSLKGQETHANSDQASHIHNQNLFPEENNGRLYPQWTGSVAEELLKKDVDNAKHKSMLLRQLWSSNIEYQAFPLKVFRKHIHQEATFYIGHNY